MPVIVCQDISIMMMEHVAFVIIVVCNAMDHCHQIVTFVLIIIQKGNLSGISVFVPIHILMTTQIYMLKLFINMLDLQG